MGEIILIIQVFGIGNHSTEFESKQNELKGVVNRAYCSSGVSKQSKSWGVGFVSFSPGIKLINSDSYSEEVKAAKLTQLISPSIKTKVFEGEFRKTSKGQEYLAMYRRSIETPTHYLLNIKSKIREGDGQSEIEKLDLSSFEGTIVSSAESISKSGSTHSYEALVLIPVGVIIRTNKATYEVVDGKVVRSGVSCSV
ncbi:hypothetical protein LIS04_131 [Listeria phage LIS04]|nr:hypothetical protein LIS04_131 [Listeria phage LIS04]